jgi:hypothetical protein
MVTTCLPAAEILPLLDSIARDDAPLRLIKPFDGILLNQDAQIIAIDQDRILVQISDIRVGFTTGSFIFLHSPSLARPVMARLVNANIMDSTLLLTDCSYQDEDWKERHCERVRPKEPVYVTLQNEKTSLRTPLDDISISGIGILTCKMIEKGFKAESGSDVRLDFQLSPDYQRIALKGTIIYQHTISKKLVKIGMSVAPNKQQIAALAHYVSHRKEEINEEINQLFLEACRPYSVEAQFF